MNYKVRLEITDVCAWIHYSVEAANEEEAKKKAWDEWEKDGSVSEVVDSNFNAVIVEDSEYNQYKKPSEKIKSGNINE